jgi:hypothetical protein
MAERTAAMKNAAAHLFLPWRHAMQNSPEDIIVLLIFPKNEFDFIPKIMFEIDHSS